MYFSSLFTNSPRIGPPKCGKLLPAPHPKLITQNSKENIDII